MLLQKDQEARVVLGDNNGMEALQGRSGGNRPDDGFADEQLGLESPIHPLGIKPSGNKLLSPGTTDAREAIGFLQALPDGTSTLLWTHCRFQLTVRSRGFVTTPGIP